MAKKRSRGPKPHKFRNKLLLNQWLISLFGIDSLAEHKVNGKVVRPFHKLAEPIRDPLPLLTKLAILEPKVHWIVRIKERNMSITPWREIAVPHQDVLKGPWERGPQFAAVVKFCYTVYNRTATPIPRSRLVPGMRNLGGFLFPGEPTDT